jgi:hypothetical protein
VLAFLFGYRLINYLRRPTPEPAAEIARRPA